MIAHQTSLGRRGKQLAHDLYGTAMTFSGGVICAIYARGRSLRGRLNDVWTEFVASVTRLAETASLSEAQDPEGKGDTGLTILGLSGVALAVVIIGIVVICILPVCIIVILALLGPAIGNVFSNIIDEI